MAAADSSSSATGVVIRFYDVKGYGFIKPDSSVSDDEDLFVHYSEIQGDGYRSIQEGQKVKFSVTVKNDKKQAVNVTSLDGSNIEPRRRDTGRDSGFRDGNRDVGRRSGFRGNGNGAGFRTGNGVDDVHCYNCGGVGHIARDCSSNLVVRSVGRCYNCNGVGHVARDCTRATGRVVGGGRGCFNCGEEGHLARDCPNGSSGNDGGRASRGGCFSCGEVGHIAKECPSGDGGRGVRRGNDGGFGGDGCFNCGKKGHIARECNDEYVGNMGRSGRASGSKSGGGGGECFKCRETGHFARECPNNS